MKNLQSWVETTIPPGYAIDLTESPTAPNGVWTLWDFGAPGGCVAWAPEKHVVCRAAWRRWTAAVLRGRGDVRAQGVDYLVSGGIVWVGGEALWASVADGPAVSLQDFDCEQTYCVQFGDRVCMVYDVDETMARFAMIVLATEGPVTP